MNSMRTADKRIHADSTNWRNDHTMQLRTKEQHEAAIKYYAMFYAAYTGKQKLRSNRSVPVQSSEGITFASVKEAAIHYGVSRAEISRAINRGYKCHGFNFSAMKKVSNDIQG